MPLMYSPKKFYIPPNLYIIGLMNLADRSIAIVDYALRRRFAFINLEPQYENKAFKEYLKNKGMKEEMRVSINEKMMKLNKKISEESTLGPNYQIGHSYFCLQENKFQNFNKTQFERIIKTEIIPLLQEYYFDDPSKIEELQEDLV